MKDGTVAQTVRNQLTGGRRERASAVARNGHDAILRLCPTFALCRHRQRIHQATVECRS